MKCEFIKNMGLNATNENGMTNLRRLPVCVFVILVLLATLIGLGKATTTYFTVKGGEKVTHSITLAVEDRVLVQFTALGEEDAHLVHFSILFPNETERDFGNVAQASYSFICDVEGEYKLNFVNNDQTIEKRVTLNYEIQHYIFGIPQMLFLTIIIVLACIGGVAAFVLMGKTYR
jgi:hypothetical protein